MPASFSFVVESGLRGSAESVWEHARSWVGVNRELQPLVTITYPASMAQLDAIPLGWRAFRGWVLLFGLFPIDFDDFTIVELDPGRGFLERSRLLSMSEWRHRRTVTPHAPGCQIRDEISMVPRWRLIGPLLARVYRLAFEYRHRRLRRLFGVAKPVRS